MTPDNNDEPDEDDMAIAALELADEERAIEEQIRKAEYLGSLTTAARAVGLANTWIYNSNNPDEDGQ